MSLVRGLIFLCLFCITSPFVTGRFSTNYFEEFYWEAIRSTHTKAESYPYVCLDEQWYFSRRRRIALHECWNFQNVIFFYVNDLIYFSGLQLLIHNCSHIILVTVPLFMHKAEHILCRPTFLKTFMKIPITGLLQIPLILWDLMHQNRRYLYFLMKSDSGGSIKMNHLCVCVCVYTHTCTCLPLASYINRRWVNLCTYWGGDW